MALQHIRMQRLDDGPTSSAGLSITSATTPMPAGTARRARPIRRDPAPALANTKPT
jgi:hypothetical protein